MDSNSKSDVTPSSPVHPVCGKCSTPLGWHSQPGGYSLAVCEKCDATASPADGAPIMEFYVCDICHLSFKQHNHVIEKSAYDKLQRDHAYGIEKNKEMVAQLTEARRELAEYKERLETVNDTNRLKQMTIQEVQRNRDQERARSAKLLEALEDMYNSACTNASSTPSKAAFLKARKAIAAYHGAGDSVD